MGLFGRGKSKKATTPKAEPDAPPAEAAPEPAGDDLFGGLNVGAPDVGGAEAPPAPAEDDLFGGMSVNSAGSENADLFGGLNVGAPAPAREVAHSASQMRSVNKAQPLRSNSSRANVPAAPPSPKIPVGGDPVQKFHITYGMGCQKLVQEFTLAGNEEIETKAKLTQLEEVRKKLKEELQESENTQNSALASEDYATADAMDQQIKTLRQKLQVLEQQRNAGINKLTESRKKKLDKLNKQIQAEDQSKNGLDGVLKSKENEYNKLTDDHTKSYTMLLTKYTTLLEQTNESENKNLENQQNCENENKEIDQKIYDESKDSSDEKNRLVNEKEGYDKEIMELEARLKFLKEKSNECEMGIKKCDQTINLVRQKYSKDLTRIQQTMKKLEDEKKKIDQNRGHCEVQYNTLNEKRKECSEVENKKEEEINDLKNEDKVLDLLIQKTKQIVDIYSGLIEDNNNMELNNYKQQIESHLKSINDATLAKQNIDAQAAVARKKVAEYETKLPQWEEQKAKAVSGKNFAIAGKLSTQIKTAQSEMETLKQQITDVESQELEQDGIITNLNHEIDTLKQRIEEIENSIEMERTNQYRQICNDLKALENKIIGIEKLENSFKTNTVSVVSNNFEHFNKLLEALCNQFSMPGLDENSVLIPEDINLLNEPLLHSNCPEPPTFINESLIPSPENQIKKLEKELEELNIGYSQAEQNGDADLMEAMRPEFDRIRNQINEIKMANGMPIDMPPLQQQPEPQFDQMQQMPPLQQQQPDLSGMGNGFEQMQPVDMGNMMGGGDQQLPDEMNNEFGLPGGEVNNNAGGGDALDNFMPQ